MGRRSRRSARWATRLFVALILIGIIIAVRWSKIGREPAPVTLLTVVKVVDGDTMELGNGETVRLLAIDTPEKGEPFYNEATGLLRRVAQGKEARLVHAERARDKYDRLLAYVYIDDTLLVNKMMVDSGLAYVYLFEDTDSRRTETALMINAQRGAIDRDKGLWTIERKAETYYVAANHSYRFHRPGCSSADEFKPGKFRTFSTRNDALREGLSPCRRCKP